MNWLAAAIWWLCCAGGLAGAGYALACAAAAARFRNGTAPRAVSLPTVTILKPLHRAEPQLRENLESFCKQDYGAPIQLILGMNNGDDGAREVADQVKASHPGLDIVVVAGAVKLGTNPKVSNLLNMLPAARHDVLVISDSDIGVDNNWLAAIMAALQAPGTGAVTCCYTGIAAAPGLWPRLSAMGINQHFLPNTLFALAHDLAVPCFGSTIALTRSVLGEIGGLGRFAAMLADDYEIGRAVRARGYRIAIPPMVVRHSCGESTAATLFRHELRWARTIRLINPMGFAGTLFTHAIPLSLLGFLVPEPNVIGAGVLAGALMSRLWLAHRMNAWFGIRDPIWLVPVRDLLSFVVFIGALFTRRVDWRGARFRVSSAGAMAQD